jgi:KDO2-lipid IV(A) lauroyltransferase
MKIDPGSRFWRRLAYAGARYGPAPWLRFSPSLFGVAFALAARQARARVRDNLRRVRGPRDSLTEHVDVLRTFAAYAHCLAESLATERPEATRASVTSNDQGALDRVLESRRGLVLGTAHVGGWDAAARWLGSKSGRDVLIVMQREGDTGARELHDNVRLRSGVRIAHLGDHPTDALPLLRHLQRGGIVAVQLDRVPPGRRSLDVQLFGEPRRVPEGPFALAALAQVPLLPLFVARRGYFAYEFEPGPVIELPRRPTRDELTSAAQLAAEAMEHFVRVHPTQWFDFHA